MKVLKHLLLATLMTVGIGATSMPAQAAEITIAAAADMHSAMDDLILQYKKTHPVAMSAVYGSSGKFFSQITNGAPFDAFFSANAGYPRELEKKGLSVPGSRFRYGIGRIVLWTPESSGLEVGKGMAILSDPRVKKIAIANPEHAPYGKAAVEAMQHAKVYENGKDRLVMGENISQTAQYVSSGNAQVGFLALSLTKTPALQSGHYWIVPSSLYTELAQEAVILKQSKSQKDLSDFFAFVRGPEGKAILTKFGFLETERK